MTLLDSEKAFAKLDYECLCEALERMGIDAHMIQSLKDWYDKATFFVQDEFGKSVRKSQASGIRQGCQLSPYLFVVVLRCIERDIAAQILEQVQENWIPGTNFVMVFFADDTIVISKNEAACEDLLFRRPFKQAFNKPFNNL